MNYFLCQDWKMTSGNHAGMVHLCKKMKEIDSANNQLIIVKDGYVIKNIWLKRIQKYIIKIDLYDVIYFWISIKLAIRLKKGDKLFLMEYFCKTRNQYLVASIIKKFFGNDVQILGQAHLVPGHLDTMFKTNELVTWSKKVDFILTFGSSLSNYFISKGINKEKIITSFHYVDIAYYNPIIETQHNGKKSPIQVLCMGNMARSFDLLSEVTKKNPQVEFVIMKGKAQISHIFENQTNVILLDYISEAEMKEWMSKVDISLNIMQDTIGSNAIVTSLSMGLAMIVSDVGSIRDYCNEENCIFCNSADDFTNAISYLYNDREKLNSMKIKSYELAQNLTIRRFYEIITTLN